MDGALVRGDARRRTGVAHRAGTVRSGGRSQVSSLEGGVAGALVAEAKELAERWRTQAPAVAPRAADTTVAGDVDRSARLVATLAGAARNDVGCYDAVLRAGWELGRIAHASGSSLHHLLKELGLLEALVLYAAERSLGAGGTGSAADGLSIARRLHRYFCVLTESAAKGFTGTYVEDLQGRFRILRHDLRNPLGTIRSAVSLMADENVPLETRASPRFRQMVVRNASSLDQVIGHRLSDAATQEFAFSRQEVSLRGIALGVRRDLRDEMTTAGCTVVVSEQLPTLEVDSSGLELALKSVVAGLAQLAAPGSEIRIDAEGSGAATAALAVHFSPAGAAPDAAALEKLMTFASEVLEQLNGRVTAGENAVRIEMPVLQAQADAAPAPRAQADVETPMRATSHADGGPRESRPAGADLAASLDASAAAPANPDVAR